MSPLGRRQLTGFINLRVEGLELFRIQLVFGAVSILHFKDIVIERGRKNADFTLPHFRPDDLFTKSHFLLELFGLFVRSYLLRLQVHILLNGASCIFGKKNFRFIRVSHSIETPHITHIFQRVSLKFGNSSFDDVLLKELLVVLKLSFLEFPGPLHKTVHESAGVSIGAHKETIHQIVVCEQTSDIGPFNAGVIQNGGILAGLRHIFRWDFACGPLYDVFRHRGFCLKDE